MQVLVQLVFDRPDHLRMPMADIGDTNARDQINVRLVFIVQINAFGPFNFQGKREIRSLRNVLLK